MDMTQTIEPKSDQINADDLLTGARTFTIEKVTGGTTEQPVNIHLVESPGKPYRPSKSMRRVLVAAWGVQSDAYIGQKLTLFRDPKIKFGGIEVGGIVISHMTGIDKPLKVSLTVTKGKKSLATIQPLQDQPAPKPQPSTITQDAWDELNSLATEKGVENVPAWISEQLGRPLQGWQEITTAEADRLRALLTDGEVQS